MTCDSLGIVQALAVPAIAFAGVWIAAEQKRLADIRLRNDMFDRRFKIYDAALTLLRLATNRQDVGGDIDTMVAYREGTQAAAFFFGTKVQAYLEEIRQNINEMNVRQAEARQGGANANNSLTRGFALQNWCANQIENGILIARFEEEMGLRPLRRFACLTLPFSTRWRN